jgi:hypothetical protein
MEPRLSKLSVVVGPDVGHLPGLRVTRDATPLSEPTWGSAVPVDPGDHVIVVTADHKKPLSRSVHVGSHADHETVTVLALDDDAVPTAPYANPTPASQTGTSSRVAPPPEARTGSGPVARPIPVLSYVAAGVGAAALASFAYFGLSGRSEYFDLKSSCGPDCTKSNVAPAHTKLVIADASLGVSVVALGIAVYAFFTRPSVTDPAAPVTARAIRLDVRAGAQSARAGIGLVF